jgi:hypothetical protein
MELVHLVVLRGKMVNAGHSVMVEVIKATYIRNNISHIYLIFLFWNFTIKGIKRDVFLQRPYIYFCFATNILQLQTAERGLDCMKSSILPTPLWCNNSS